MLNSGLFVFDVPKRFRLGIVSLMTRPDGADRVSCCFYDQGEDPSASSLRHLDLGPRSSLPLDRSRTQVPHL